MKRWMIVMKKRNVILLHLNEELPQYKKFKRINTKKLIEMLREAK